VVQLLDRVADKVVDALRRRVDERQRVVLIGWNLG
jgi:hypothetical protein